MIGPAQRVRLLSAILWSLCPFFLCLLQQHSAAVHTHGRLCVRSLEVDPVRPPSGKPPLLQLQGKLHGRHHHRRLSGIHSDATSSPTPGIGCAGFFSASTLGGKENSPLT